MPEAGRQVIYGLVTILMLLVYGRGERVTGWDRVPIRPNPVWSSLWFVVLSGNSEAAARVGNAAE
jgi:hypothetical protein